MKTKISLLLFTLFAAACTGRASDTIPLFDAHLHYNAEARGPYPLDHVLDLFRKSRVTGILANSRPNEGTHALYGARSRDLWVVPFIRPYIVQPDRYTWFNNPKIFELIEAEEKRGYFQGIGEFHLFGDDARSPWVKKTVDFAVSKGLYLHAHSDEKAVDILFEHNPKSKIIWAHTGFTTEPEIIETYLNKYPNLWCELSYRYDVTQEGMIKPSWKKLFEKYPGRFVVGSDTWINDRWGQYLEIMDGYRHWLAQLSRDTAEKIAWRNAESLFRR